jgi:serine/threonine protein kinase
MLKADGYNLIKELGKGGFGHVWLATDKNNKQVAIKFLLDNNHIEIFKREVTNLNRQIDNKFVVDIIEAKLDIEHPYIVMEYCKEGSLKRFCESPNDWKEVFNVMSNLVHGLHGIHKLNGFHRDIKPDNILIKSDENNRPIFILSDMGLARVRTASANSKMTNSPHGTDAYKAPELFSRNPEFTLKCDIYSFGVSMVELFTGERLRRVPPRIKTPSRFINLLNSMISESPDNRPNTIEISRQLKRLTEPDLPIIIKDPPPSFGLAEFLLGGLAAAGLLALLAGGEEKKWDKNVGRYRGKDGKFRSE